MDTAKVLGTDIDSHLVIEWKHDQYPEAFSEQQVVQLISDMLPCVVFKIIFILFVKLALGAERHR